VFRYAPQSLPDAALDPVNRSARERLFGDGEAVVAGTTVDGRAYLKLTLLNPATTVEDVEQVLALLREHAAAAADAARADLRRAG
jgi:L-2,4-diaminobutyrate decarboxylase